MIGIATFELSFIANAKGAEDVEKAFEGVTNQIELANRQLEIFIQRQKSDIQALKDDIRFLQELQISNKIGTGTDVVISPRKGVSGGLVDQLAKDIRDLRRSGELIISLTKSIGALSQKGVLEDTIESGELPFGLGKVTPAKLEELKRKLEEINSILDALGKDQDRLIEERDLIQDPFQFRIDKKEEEIKRLEKIIEEAEKLLEQGKGLEDLNLETPQGVSRVIESQERLNETVANGIEIVDLNKESLLGLDDKLVMVGGAYGNVIGNQSEFSQEIGNTTEAVNGAKVALEGAGGAAEDYGDSLQQVENSGGFFQGLKDGFVEFAESVESNSELIADFFANTLSQMSKNFSDLFFNVIKGNFDNLKDLAEQAFDAILRSFLDLVSAIATRQIVISIAGLFGIGTKGASATDVITGGAGAAGDIIGGASAIGGLFGSSAAAAVPTSSTLPGLNALLGVSAAPAATPGILATAIPVVGAVLAAAAIAAPFIISALKKSPRLDLDFDTFRDEFGKSTGEAAKVLDFLNEDVFNNEIFSRSVSRKAGLGLGSELPNVIREAIEGQINAIQDIINQLPSELAVQLNDALLNTSVDIESEIKGDRLLEFDETKKIAEKFQQFIEGDLQARFIFSIREFFVGAFESLGVLGDSAQSFVDQQFEEFQNLSGREARAEFGQEFLGSFQTLVDAFNVLNDNGVDSIGATVNQVKNLSNTLGFDAVPSIDELDRGLEELISAAELDPELIQDFLDLRAAILQVQSAILSSISSIIGNISQLNSTIVSLGGSAVNLTGFINQGLDASLGLLGQEGLSLDDQEAVLDQALGFANQLLAEEQAIFQRRQEAAQRAAEARAEQQRRAVQAQIDGLEREKELIRENFDKRIEALQDELQIAQEFERLTESIRSTLESIIFSPESVLTPIEQVGLAQSDITRLEGELSSTGDLERQAEIAGQLEEAFERLFGLAGDAFGVNSPEFVAIFDQVTGGLEGLAELTENSSRSVEEINAEIESLNLQRNQILEAMDQRIDQAQERLASIQTQNVEATFQASDRVREVFELIRDEYIRIFEERMAQLEEVSELGFETEISALNALVGVEEDSLITLRSIEAILSGAASFRGGSGGVVDFGNRTLAFLHGREAVVPESQITPFDEFRQELGGFGEMNVNLSVNVNGGSDAAVQTVSTEIENMLVRSIRQGGKLRSAIQEAGARRIN